MPRTSPQPPHVLLVDDDPGLRLALEFRLAIDGFSVRTFGSGEALVEQRALPDDGCLILDWRLPGMNGLQTLRALRQRNLRLPAILITSNPGPELRAEASAADVPIVEKPLLTNELEDRIKRLLTTEGGKLQ